MTAPFRSPPIITDAMRAQVKEWLRGDDSVPRMRQHRSSKAKEQGEEPLIWQRLDGDTGPIARDQYGREVWLIGVSPDESRQVECSEE